MARSSLRPGWLRRLISRLGAHRWLVLGSIGGAIAAQVITALAPLVQRQIIDQVIVRHSQPLLPWIGLLVVAGVARFLLSASWRYLSGRASLEVQYDFRTAIYDHLQRLDFARHDELQTGQVVSRAISDISLLQQLLTALPMAFANAVFFLVALLVLVLISPPLALVALGAVPFMLLVAVRLRERVYPATWDAQQQAAVVAGVVEEAVTGVRVVKGFGQERRELRRLAEAARRNYASRVRAIRLRARFVATLQMLPWLAQVTVLALGGWLALNGRLTLGTFLVAAAYTTQLQAPIRMLANLFAIGQQSRAGVERLNELLDSTPLVTEAPGAADLVVSRGEVVFDSVVFGYLRSEPVLDGFNLTVRPGETVALVGMPGSGKSTVSLLMPRFYDVQGGSISIDGQDVREVCLDSLRSQIGMVFEDTFLFSDTIRRNIAYGRPRAGSDEVEAAARAVEAHGFISELPDGYETVVGEQGLTLSGGQRQRIALARALLTDPRLLILDDATSAVDSRIEEEIHATLRRLLPGRSTMLVARRRSSLNLADRIAVVDGGRVVDSGTYDELFVRSPLFRLLLSGPGGDAEAQDAGEVPAAAAAVGAASEPAVDGVTPSLWQRRGELDPVTAMAASGRLNQPAQGTVPFTGVAGNLAPSPELHAKLAALPPASDQPDIGVEEAATPDPTFSFVRFTSRWRRQLALALVLVLLDSAATLAGPALIKLGIDAGVVKGSLAVVLAVSAVYLLVVGVDWFINAGQGLISGRTAERILYALRIRVFAHLQKLSLSYYEREMGGRIMTRMTTDIDALSQLLQSGLVNALVALATSGGVAAILLSQQSRLGLAALSVLPLVLAATWWFQVVSRRAYADSRDRIATVNADFQEGVAGVRVAQAFVREERNQRRFARLSRAYVTSRLRAQRASSLYFPFVAFAADVSTVVVLAYGAVLIAGGATTLGVLVAFLLYLALFFTPIQQLSLFFDSFQQSAVAVSRIRELLSTPTLTPDASAPRLPGKLTGRIDFEAVRFAYPGTSREALAGVDLKISAGETVALVGETGAGKSTVLKLIARYYDPSAGRVCVDGIDLRSYDLQAFRAQLGVVPQEPFLFAGTVRDNIAYGRPGASDAEVEGAARAVGAHGFVSMLPGGYLHVIGERGRTLSIGQRQLLALARALLVDPAILLLDEATANLDLATEAQVVAATATTSAGRTTVLIAHRLSTAARADRILVVDAGRIVEDGSHERLLAAGGPYALLWQAFAVGRRTA